MNNEENMETTLVEVISEFQSGAVIIDNDDIETEIEIIKKALLNKQLSEGDLGGLKALRGFIYQYLVAIYYMIEIAYEDKWHLLTFELLDDIALINNKEKRVRYVQVKTKREDNTVRTLTIGDDLVKRSDGKLNGWIDKLFKSHDIQIEGIRDFKVEYELATNEKVHLDINQYKTNEDYGLVNIDTGDKLFVSMKKPGNPDYWNESDLINNLKSLRIRNFNPTDQLYLLIQRKIASKLINKEEEESYFKAVAEYIIRELIHRIALRTCDDSKKKGHDNLLFTKEEITEWVGYGYELGIQAMSKIDNSVNKRAYLKKIFENLCNRYKHNWDVMSADLLIQYLGDIEQYFISQDNKDPYFYNKFVSRLFDLENNKNYQIKRDSEEESRIKTAIDYLVFLYVFNKENNMCVDESNFVFKQGVNWLDNLCNYAICNMSKRYNYSESKEMVYYKADTCIMSKTLNHEYYCIINDSLDDDVHLEFESLFNEVENIPKITEQGNTMPSLIDRFKKIYFLNGNNDIQKFIDQLQLRNNKSRIKVDDELAKNYFNEKIISN